MIRQAVDYWHHVALLLRKLGNKDGFNAFAEALNDFLDIVSDDASHSLVAQPDLLEAAT